MKATLDFMGLSRSKMKVDHLPERNQLDNRCPSWFRQVSYVSWQDPRPASELAVCPARGPRRICSVFA
jgi:hypothetical protein